MRVLNMVFIWSFSDLPNVFVLPAAGTQTFCGHTFFCRFPSVGNFIFSFTSLLLSRLFPQRRVAAKAPVLESPQFFRSSHKKPRLLPRSGFCFQFFCFLSVAPLQPETVAKRQTKFLPMCFSGIPRQRNFVAAPFPASVSASGKRSDLPRLSPPVRSRFCNNTLFYAATLNFMTLFRPENQNFFYFFKSSVRPAR